MLHYKYKEVIAKNISPAVSQFALVALARAGIVFISEALTLLEMIVSRRERIWKQSETSARQKEFDFEANLTVMQKSTDKQLMIRLRGKMTRLFREPLGQFFLKILISRLSRKTRNEGLKTLPLLLMVEKLRLIMMKKINMQKQKANRLFPQLRQLHMQYPK